MKSRLAILISLALSLFALPANAVELNYGYDVSHPQCASEGSSDAKVLPSAGPFSVVGVNGGLVYAANSCLESLLSWAGPTAELYVNTGNPGPVISTLSPSGYRAGSVGGRACFDTNRDSDACAFMYGYRAAEDSYLKAKAAFEALNWTGLGARTWWLDLEIDNSWRKVGANRPSDDYLTDAQAKAKNIASLEGAVFYLESVAKVNKVGFYGASSHWEAIVGDTSVFSDHETWLPVGTDGEDYAKSQCQIQPSARNGVKFTKGPITRVQYIDPESGLDVNIPCVFPKTNSTTKYAGSKTAKRNRAMTLKATLKTALGAPMVNQAITLRFNGKNYYLKTDSSGVATKKIAAPRFRGNYKVRVTFSGNTILNGSSQTTYSRIY